MARDIFEKDKLSVVALLQQGKPAGSTIEFIFKMDGKDFPDGKGKIDGKIVTDATARSGKAAACTFETPAVPPDKPHYLLEYAIKVDGKEISDRSQFKVWPKTGKLTVVHDDGGKAFPGFQFNVTQNGKPVGKPFKAAAADPSVAEFTLEKGHDFALADAAPYEIKSSEKNGTALRDLKAKGVLHFTAEFVKPVIPASKKIRQWVNLPATAEKGRDGLGSRILFQVGVKDDRKPDGTPKAELVGHAGVTVFVKVKFGPDPGKSKRDSPKTELRAGANASDIVAVTDGKEYTAKVDLAAAGGVGEFEVELGLAGGDNCVVSIGSTPACADADVEIANWRRLYYELKFPAMMTPKLDTIPVDGANVKDYPSAITSNVKTKLADVFVEYSVLKSHEFPDADATPANQGGLIVPAAYMEENDGVPRYICTSGIVDGSSGFSDDAAKKPLTVYATVCDRAFSTSTTRSNFAIDVTSDDFLSPIASGFLFEPSPKNGRANLKVAGFEWHAKIADPTPYLVQPAVSFEADVNRDDPDNKTRKVTVTETQQGKSVDVVYPSPLIGHIPSDLDATRTAILGAFLNTLYDVATLRSHGNTLKFQLTGLTGDDRRTARFQAIKDYLTNQVPSTAPQVPTHPGLADDGTPRHGPTNLAWLKFDTVKKVRIKLGKSAAGTAAHLRVLPGDFVGAAETATQCPISVGYSLETTYSINGNAGGGEQLMVLRSSAPKPCAETVCHELGHSMGMCIIPGTANEPAPPQIEVHHVDDGGTYYVNDASGPWVDGKRNLHVGGHCARNCPPANLSDSKFGGWSPSAATLGCIMWGSGGSNETRPSYCVTCVEILKARRLEDIRTASASRPA